MDSIFNYNFYAQNAEKAPQKLYAKKERPEVNIISSSRKHINDENINTLNSRKTPRKNTPYQSPRKVNQEKK